MILGIKDNGSLGDALYLTSAVNELNKRGEKVVVQMHKDEQCRAVSRVFENLTEVEYTDTPVDKLYENKRNTHAAQVILNKLGIDNVNCIPKIKLTPEEIEWAKNFLSQYEYKNAIIVINDNAGSHDPTNIGALYKRPPVDLMQFLADGFTKDGFTVFQFGRKEEDRFTPLKNVVYMRGLNIRQLAACYSLIGKIISGDTGDYHLMLSVGGEAYVLCPEESELHGYIYHELHYTPELFREEKVRVMYSSFMKDNTIYNYDKQ